VAACSSDNGEKAMAIAKAKTAIRVLLMLIPSTSHFYSRRRRATGNAIVTCPCTTAPVKARDR
jgi:hypothetical protein